MLNIKKLYPTTLKTGISKYQRFNDVLSLTQKLNFATTRTGSIIRASSDCNSGLQTFYQQQLIGGQHMRIKFKRMENFQTKPNASGKSYPMVRVIGEALQGSMIGQEWSTKFFPSNKDMHSVAKSANVDEIIEITMKKNGTFLNPVSMEIVSDDVAAVDSQVSAAVQPAAVQPVVSKSVLRRNNLQVAVAIIGPKKAKDSAIDYLQDAGGSADLVDDYSKEEGAFKFNKETAGNGIPDADDVPDADDAPDVPDVQDFPI